MSFYVNKHWLICFGSQMLVSQNIHGQVHDAITYQCILLMGKFYVVNLFIGKLILTWWCYFQLSKFVQYCIFGLHQYHYRQPTEKQSQCYKDDNWSQWTHDEIGLGMNAFKKRSGQLLWKKKVDYCLSGLGISYVEKTYISPNKKSITGGGWSYSLLQQEIKKNYRLNYQEQCRFNLFVTRHDL